VTQIQTKEQPFDTIGLHLHHRVVALNWGGRACGKWLQRNRWNGIKHGFYVFDAIPFALFQTLL
jgi:hypothetical protein